MILSFASILVVGLIGGLVPLLWRWSDRAHHAALAFSTGIFLGAVFLHLLPSVQAGRSEVHAGFEDPGEIAAERDLERYVEKIRAEWQQEHSGHDHASHDHSGHDHSAHAHGADDHAGHSHGPVGPWLWVLIGVVGVFFIEALFVPGAAHGHGHGSDRAQHSAVGWTALLGLSIHALTAGVALAAVQEKADLAGVMLLAILAHKGFESFSLASVFKMSGLRSGRVVALVVAFSLVTPVGLVLGSQVTQFLGAQGVSVLTSLSAGTFLYVSLCELLPEVFHQRTDGPLKIILLMIGVACMWFVHSIGGV